MAKKKNKEMNPIIKVEITGLIVLAMSILLFFGLGYLSRAVSAIFIFLFGNTAFPLYVVAAVIAVTMMIGRKTDILAKSQKIALALFCVSILGLVSMYNQSDLKFTNYVSELGSNIYHYIKVGDGIDFEGGIIGFIIVKTLTTLISKIGTIIVFSVMLLSSIILLFQKPMREYFAYGSDKVEKIKSRMDEKEPKPAKQSRVKQKAVKTVSKPEIFNYEDVVDNKNDGDLNEFEKQEDADEAISFDDVATEEIVNVDVVKQTVKKSGKYILPPLTLLADSPGGKNLETGQELQSRAKLLVQTLGEFGVESNVVAINVGPTVTQFEIELKVGTKLSKVKNLSGEIALALAAKDVRIQAPIPQKSTVGIEIPNNSASLVTLKEIIKAIPKSETNKTIFGLGKDIMGKPIYAALNKMPHMLVAGATGSGKSVCINSIIISIAMRAKPEEVKMLMIDPKKVELSGYNGLPHLMAPVVTNPKKASTALQKIVAEMERRYEIFSDAGCKNIESFNQKMLSKNLDASTIPYIVVIVDELADLMLVASKEVEDSIMRITQMARAAGIHLIVATQRPSTDIITGVIKSNIPSRIAFGVSSSIDSRTILDSVGAEKLLGKGDMLFVPMGTNHPIRIQGAFLSEEEVESVVHYCSQQQVAQYDEVIANLDENTSSSQGSSEDELYEEVLLFVIENGSASTSLLQRKFRIGYNRASRLIDDLEMNGIIGPQNGSKPREVITDEVF